MGRSGEGAKGQKSVVVKSVSKGFNKSQASQTEPRRGLQETRQGYQASFQRSCVVVNVHSGLYNLVSCNYCKQTAAWRRFHREGLSC